MNNYNYNYAFVFYDIGEKRVNKVFKVCKKYFKHHQKSVFRGHITPSNIIKLRDEINNIIDQSEDFVTIIKMLNQNSFDEETLGKNEKNSESIVALLLCCENFSDKLQNKQIKKRPFKRCFFTS